MPAASESASAVLISTGSANAPAEDANNIANNNMNLIMDIFRTPFRDDHPWCNTYAVYPSRRAIRMHCTHSGYHAA
jgi:hypothetical protein